MKKLCVCLLGILLLLTSCSVASDETRQSVEFGGTAAIEIMKARLAALEKQKARDAQSSQRRSQIGTGDRSERIRTYNYPQGRVTDHRIGLSLYDLNGFLNGNLNEMTEALTLADRAARLAGEE